MAAQTEDAFVSLEGSLNESHTELESRHFEPHRGLEISIEMPGKTDYEGFLLQLRWRQALLPSSIRNIIRYPHNY